MKEKVLWTQEEIDQISQHWIAQRLENPFENATCLMNSTIQTVLPSHRQRKLATIPPNVRSRIGSFYKQKLEQAQESPPPIILEIETQKPFDYATAVAALELPALAAILVGKLQIEWDKNRHGLEAIVKSLGRFPAEPPPRPVHVPSVFQQQPQKKRLPRVLLVGPTKTQAEEIQEQVTRFDIPVEVRWHDAEKLATAPQRGDYAVLTRHVNHKWFDGAKALLGSSRVFFLPSTGVDTVVQKLRDIASMNRHN